MPERKRKQKCTSRTAAAHCALHTPTQAVLSYSSSLVLDMTSSLALALGTWRKDQRNMPCWPTNTELHARRDRQVEGKQSNTPTSAHASLHTSWVDRRRNPLPPACPCAKTRRAWSLDLTPPPLHPRLRLLSNMPRMRFDSMLACSYAPMMIQQYGAPRPARSRPQGWSGNTPH